MIIAITSKNEEIFQYFDKNTEIILFEIENNMIKDKKIISINLEKYSEFDNFLALYNINILICGKIDGDKKNLLREKKIEIIPNVSGKVDEIIIKYLSGEKIGNIE